MRIILATIAFVLFSLPSWAVNNEYLRENCKTYADNNFSLEGLDNLKLVKASFCMGYMVSALEHGIIMCKTATELSKSTFDTEIQEYMLMGGSLSYSSWGTRANHNDINAIIQSYINWANENPKEWNAYPSSNQWLSNNWPCEIGLE